MELNDLPATLMIVCLPLAEICLGQVITGGLQPANVDNGKLEQIANVGVDYLNKKSEENQLLKLLRVEDAQTQMAQGRVYHLKLNVASTNCTKETESDETDNCEAIEESSRKLCSVKVWEWRGRLKATKARCENAVEQPSQTTEQLIEAISDSPTASQVNVTEEGARKNVTVSSNSSFV